MTSPHAGVVRLRHRGRLVELSDSRVRGFARREGTLSVTLLLWDESEVQLRITEVLAVREVLCGEVSHIQRRDIAEGSCPFEKETLGGYYGASGGQLAAFDFVDHEDRVSLTVITTPSGEIQVDER